MKRNNQFEQTKAPSEQELISRIAYHEAGHAAAIYLRNKQKNLPPVHFQITINKPDSILENPFETRSMPDEYIAAVEGGRLIQSLPITLIESANYFSSTEQDVYQTAFEADMINLLVGPLAEAKHVAIRDNESFGRHLLNVNSLRFYGGSSDLERVQDYLGNFVSDSNKHEEKIAELFKEAFVFIDTPRYWRAISSLAAYVLENRSPVISCEEAIVVLEKGVAPPPCVKLFSLEYIENSFRLA